MNTSRKLAIILVDGITAKTKRLVNKALSCCDSNTRLLVGIIQSAMRHPNDDAAFDGCTCKFGDLYDIAAEVEKLAYSCVSVVAINQSVLVPALALSKLLRISPRRGILQACDKRITRLLGSKSETLCLDYVVVVPGEQRCSAQEFYSEQYIVKPCYGTSGNGVQKFDTWDLAYAYASSNAVKRDWLSPECRKIFGDEVDDAALCMIEPYIDGTEFSIDGWKYRGSWDAVVHHKLNIRYNHSFMDDITVSPPIQKSDLPSEFRGLFHSEDEIIKFGLEVLEALDFTEGVFHIECRERVGDYKLVVIDVNARAPGGGLWRSALLRTGYDLELIDAKIQMKCELDFQRVNHHRYVLHFPVYGTTTGTLSDWGEIIPDPEFPNMTVDYAERLGKIIVSKDLNEECYLAFVVSHAASLQECLREVKRLKNLKLPIIC